MYLMTIFDTGYSYESLVFIGKRTLFTKISSSKFNAFYVSHSGKATSKAINHGY